MCWHSSFYLGMIGFVFLKFFLRTNQPREDMEEVRWATQGEIFTGMKTVKVTSIAARLLHGATLSLFRLLLRATIVISTEETILIKFQLLKECM